MSVHTPGPWSWSGITNPDTGRGHYSIVNEQTEEVVYRFREEISGHDVRLMAAAPELLAACEAVLNAYHTKWTTEIDDREKDLLRAAIDSAKGVRSGISQ